MSVQAMTWVLEYSEARLGARLVLLSIANHADRRGENAWPSVSTIAIEAHLSERLVQYALKELVELGELQIARSAGPKGVHKYRLPGVTEPVLALRKPQDAGEGGAKFAPVQNQDSAPPGGAKDDTEGVQNRAKRGAKSAPKPSLTVHEPSRARDRDDLTVALARRILAVLGEDQLPADARRTILPLEDWLARGADGDADILPTIERVVATQREANPSWRPHSWHEFTEEIARAVGARSPAVDAGSTGEEAHA